ncbi:MAG: methyltransferase domain-containing protein [Dehalococcoidales bacterium]|nr:MAG: methyltransferase domain-containing protein [Dehalococcoidales bacterium]
MPEKNSWQEYFDSHAPRYMQNPFTYGTLKEIDFLVEELALPKASRILDIGCGTGRHTIELAKHGYIVTGVDISSGMLAEAEAAAKDEGVEIEVVNSNAAEYRSEPVFDAAICLCEGAFCLLGEGDDPHERDVTILRNFFSALKPGAKFILTALYGCMPIRQYMQEDIDSGIFDPVTMVETHLMEKDDSEDVLIVRERSYTPPELVLLFRIAGFKVENVWGGTAGNWGKRPLDLDEMEVMITARKPVL